MIGHLPCFVDVGADRTVPCLPSNANGALAFLATPACAQDKIKVAIGQIDAWANQIPTLGMQAGIFQKHGIEQAIGGQLQGISNVEFGRKPEAIEITPNSLHS